MKNDVIESSGTPGHYGKISLWNKTLSIFQRSFLSPADTDARAFASSLDRANSLVYIAAFAYILVPSIIVLLFFGRWPIPVLLASALSAVWWSAPRFTGQVG